MPTTRKRPTEIKRAPRSAARKPQPVITDDHVDDDADGFVPIRLSSADKLEEIGRVTIAHLDDYEVTMPSRLPAGLALRIMRTSRKSGDAQAMAMMLEEAIGDEAFERLAAFPTLTDENLADLFLVVQKVAMGAVEHPLDSSRNG